MSLIEPKGRPYIACPKCGANVVWPESMSGAEKGSFAETTRKNRIEGARFGKSKLGLGLGEAKTLAFHVSSEHGRCHRCAGPITGEIAICPKCRSANLDW